jgi:hypothetical protein
MRPSKRLLVGAMVALLLLFASVYLWGPSKTPAGQAPLATLSESSFANFQSAFDSAADQPRILLLLSPT